MQVKFFDELNVAFISAGNEHIAVITKYGEVYTVGFNGSGQLGHGSNRSYILESFNISCRISMPKKIESLKGIKISSISSANGCENLALIS